jgi:hypothetical protein
MTIEQVVNAVDTAIYKLPYMENLYRQIKDEVDKIQYTRQSLVNDITALELKISILDKIAFSSEQDCKRTEQQVQELADKKDRIEKLIANILNGEGYSKIKQIVKENVKAGLAENKKLISVSFAVIIQTLRTDPQTINVIYKILAANDGEQHKDDNNSNAIKYLESNMDNILDLAEKNYENLVEALTNNVMNTAANSSYNPKLSLPQSSSSTFPNLYNQSDTYRIEKSESFHHSKGDIAD